MEARESFVFYRSFYESMEELSVEQRERLFSAITEYAIYGNELEISGIVKALFTVIKPSLDANRKKYEDGKKGGRPKSEKQSSDCVKTSIRKSDKPKASEKKTSGFEKSETSGCCEQESTVAVTDAVTDAENEAVSVSVSEYDTPFPGAQTARTRSSKNPTIDEVIEYAESRDRVDLAEKFFDYYDAADWYDQSGNKVRAWKQKFITWEQRTPKPEPQKEKKTKDGRTIYVDWDDDSQFLN